MISAAMELRNGTKLGCYEILGPLGSGGMGEVYKALDTRLGRPVAIKVLAQHLGATPEARQRFEREARVVSNLSDPHICILHDVGSHDGNDFLVMEYLEGGTLAQRISRGPLPVPELLEIAVEIAGALATAHRQGVLHRDLKPGNIMLTNSGAKLMDFGLARAAVAPAVDLSGAPTSSRPLARNSSDEPLTAKGTVLGTFQYMAPELIEGHEAGPQSDIFSFGAVLYEMASGHKAFDGKSPASVMAAILEREPTSISALQPMTPAGLEQLVKECLAKNPEERWQSIYDVKLALQGLQARWSKEEGLRPRVNGTASREKFAWSLALLLLAASSFLAWNHFKAAPHAIQTVRSSILPPASSSFLPYNFAISSDGARLAFVGVGADGGNSL